MKNLASRWVTAAFFPVLVSCAASSSPPSTTPKAEPAPAVVSGAKAESADPLVALNETARASYRAGKERILAHLGPTIVLEGDKLVFLRDGRREEAEIHPRGYHELKTIAHVALALEALLGDVDGPLDESRIEGLKRFRARIDPAVREFASHGYSGPTVDRQMRIMSTSTALIDGVIERRAVSHASYLQFARSVGPLFLANVEEAARAELDAIHGQVLRWKSAMAPAEWSQLRVVVIGSHMARDQALEMQYFQRLLGEPAEGNRVVFAEGLWEEKKALDLQATHLLDARMGEAFFGDPMRMHRDVLADATAAYLFTLLPKGR